MRRFSAPLIAILFASACLAERYKLTFIPGSPAGEQLELIQHQIETSRKIEQMEWFVKNFPEHEAVSYILEWLQVFYSRANDHAKVIETGERLLAKHPDDFDAVWRCRTAAQQSNDPGQLQKWNSRALQLAATMVVSPKPTDIDDATWQQTLALAKGLLEHAEYEQFTNSLQPTSPREKVLALEAFLAKYPKSKYAAQIWPHLMNAHRALGDSAKALSAATKLLANDPANIDALLLTGQILLEQRSNYAKVQANGARVLELVAKQAKPQDMTPQEWQKRKDYYIGSAHLMIGNTYVNSNNFVMADKHLRAALPYMKGSGQTEGAILFYLGWANYNLEQYEVAAGFFRMCTAFGGQFGEQAARNVSAMKRERRIP
jgi:tetratricopeptide (TPR) repeat protein